MLDLIAYAIGLGSLYLLVQAVRPLVEAAEVTAEDWDRIDDEASNLLARRDRLVEELRDLEFEAALNKVGEKDLALLRADFERRALEVESALAAARSEYDEQIEADVDARLEAAAKPKQAEAAEASEVEIQAKSEPVAEVEAEPDADESVDEPAAEMSREPGEDSQAADPRDPAEGRCVACESPMPVDAKFCDECGAPREIPCAACEAPNRPGAKFCKGCGEKLAPKAEVAS